VLALGAGGCGGGSGTSAGTAGTAPDTAATTGGATDTAATTTAPPLAGGGKQSQSTAAVPACSSALGGFLSELDHLRKSLVIGVSYEQYVAELATVRRSYAKVPVDSLDFACLSGPATAAEDSFDGYLAAANVWGDCVSEEGCETASLEPRLQREWRSAAEHLRAAEHGADEARS
jgi:hypothetical protein